MTSNGARPGPLARALKRAAAMQPPSTVLVAFDGSKPATAALKRAAELSRAAGGKVVAVYVVSPYTFPVDLYGVGVADLTQQHREWAERMLAEAVGDLRREGHAAESRLLDGGPAEELARAALADDVWMVAVGASGRGAVSRVLLGSVADRLVHICSKPVLVVR